MLNKRQIKAIALLMEPRTPTETGAALGVSARTVQRWLTEPEFTDTIKRAIDEQLDNFARENAHGVSKLAKLSRDAIQRILENPREAGPDTLLKAAAIVQSQLIKLMELRARLGERDAA